MIRIMAYILVLDVELTGPLLLEHALISIGAVLIHVNTLATVSRFDVLMNVPQDKTWDPKTVSEFWTTKPYLIEIMNLIKDGKGMSPKNGIDNFVGFLKQCRESTNKKGGMLICSNRVDIDCTWINYYLALFNYPPLSLIFGTFDRIVDTNSFHQGVAHITHEQVRDWELNNNHNNFSCSESAFQYLSIKKRPTTKYTHTAMDDAEHTGQAHGMVLQKIRTLPRTYQQNCLISSIIQKETLLNNYEDWESINNVHKHIISPSKTTTLPSKSIPTSVWNKPKQP